MTTEQFRPGRWFRSWQRLFIVASAVLLGGYVFGVLWHVQAVPDIGLYCVFRPIVNRVDPRFLDPSSARNPDRLRGATIVSVGAKAVETWPQLVRELERLEQATYAESATLPDGGPDDAVRVDGVEWVRV